MVIGLDLFAKHFADYKDRYMLIGGTAMWLVLDDAGLDPRATKDLDIVLCLEALDADFGRVFWDFIQQGEYEIQEKSTGGKAFYRFSKPAKHNYPAMLELFCRAPDVLPLVDDAHLTPIPMAEDVSSLSAILLDDSYYGFLHQHARVMEGVSIVGEECLIPLKAKAWLDLTARKAEGAAVDSKAIRKHRNDILRLYQLLSPEANITLPDTIKEDMSGFLDDVKPEVTTELLKNMHIHGVTPAEILETIRRVYAVTKQSERYNCI